MQQNSGEPSGRAVERGAPNRVPQALCHQPCLYQHTMSGILPNFLAKPLLSSKRDKEQSKSNHVVHRACRPDAVVWGRERPPTPDLVFSYRQSWANSAGPWAPVLRGAWAYVGNPGGQDERSHDVGDYHTAADLPAVQSVEQGPARVPVF